MDVRDALSHTPIEGSWGARAQSRMGERAVDVYSLMIPMQETTDNTRKTFLCPSHSMSGPALRHPIALPMNAKDDSSDVCRGDRDHIPFLSLPNWFTNPFNVSSAL